MKPNKRMNDLYFGQHSKVIIDMERGEREREREKQFPTAKTWSLDPYCRTKHHRGAGLRLKHAEELMASQRTEFGKVHGNNVPVKVPVNNVPVASGATVGSDCFLSECSAVINGDGYGDGYICNLYLHACLRPSTASGRKALSPTFGRYAPCTMAKMALCDPGLERGADERKRKRYGQCGEFVVFVSLVVLLI